MPKIKCNAETCGFNCNCCCQKRNVTIEGMFSKSKVGTFCQSFQNPHNSETLKSEMAREMLDEPLEECDCNIHCTANYCYYNQNECCTKEDILVGSSNAKYKSETQCDSFKAKK